jgi:hypothetical protein
MLTNMACGLLMVAACMGQADVWLLAGQSNMQGSGRVDQLPADVPKNIPHAFFWSGKEFEPLALGKTKTSNTADRFGPEIGFALAMATSARPVYLIKYHASGMPLHHGINGGTWVGPDPGLNRRNFYPGEKSADPNAGILYRAMLVRFRDGINNLAGAGKAPVVRGFLWMQGEQDAKHEIAAKTYANSMRRLKVRLGEDLGVAFPMIYGQALPHEPAMARFTHRMELRRQMALADQASGHPEAIHGAIMVSTDGFGLLSDTVHYDTSGQLKLGRAMAEAARKIQGNGNQ